MSFLSQSSVKNRLLRTMSPDDYALLARHLKLVDLPKSEILIVPNEPITHAFFPETCMASVVAIAPDGDRVESGIVGCEGMIDSATVLRSRTTPLESFVQIEGCALRLPAEELLRACEQSPSLHTLLLQFTQTLMVQAAYTALTNAKHTVEERLGRWLLMTHDRTTGNDLPLTHEFLSIMLGVRRPSVTTALHMLEGEHFIRAKRGHITILDRAGLEDFSGSTYGPPEAEYGRRIRQGHQTDTAPSDGA